MMPFWPVPFNIHFLITLRLAIVVVVVMFGAIFGFTRMKIRISLNLFYFRADVFYHHRCDLSLTLSTLSTILHVAHVARECAYVRILCETGHNREMESASTI